MTTHRESKRSHARLRRLALLTGLGVLAVASITIVGQAQAVQRLAANREVEVGASYRFIPDLQTLTQTSDLVVVGRVAGAGTTHIVAQPVPQPKGQTAAAPVPNAPGDKNELAKNLSLDKS